VEHENNDLIGFAARHGLPPFSSDGRRARNPLFHLSWIARESHGLNHSKKRARNTQSEASDSAAGRALAKNARR
jgi:hypothetical protein